MNVELAVAGWICVALAAGHTTIGVRWILPSITQDQVPATPFGPRSFSVNMIRVTWFVVTVFALGMGGLLLTLAWTDVDPRTVILRWLAGMWLAATVMVPFVSPMRGRSLGGSARLPVPLLWVAVAVLCWVAST
jgi:hypothetical protein